MIKYVDDAGIINTQRLCESCCGKRILSYLSAYGMGYDFCRFYTSGEDSVILLINSTMLIDGGGFDVNELKAFIKMNLPFRIEGNQTAIECLYDMEGYHKLHRTCFKLCSDENTVVDENDINSEPILDDVYSILSEGFPNLLDYPIWLADTSHRMRHGISKIFTYKNSTTASIVFDIDNFVLVGQVATKISARGSGYARALLKWLAAYLKKQNKTAVLNALDTRESFYREIGFEIYSSEYVLERIDNKNESAVKGMLNAND